MKAVSGKVGVRVPNDAKVTATVGIGPRSEGGFGITADLKISLPGVERAKAARAAERERRPVPAVPDRTRPVPLTRAVAGTGDSHALAYRRILRPA